MKTEQEIIDRVKFLSSQIDKAIEAEIDERLIRNDQLERSVLMWVINDGKEK